MKSEIIGAGLISHKACRQTLNNKCLFSLRLGEAVFVHFQRNKTGLFVSISFVEML